MKFTLPPLITLKHLSWQSVLIGFCLVLAYLNLMLILQHPTSTNIGQGWDGYYYYRMAMHADLSDFYYRFLLRYGLPWLAGVFPTVDVFVNFKIINLSCALLYMLCCYFILARCSANMHAAVPLIGWGLICMSNLAPVPSVLWYPIQTDIVCSLFALLFLMMLITGRISLLAIVLLFFTGTTVRENFPEFLLFALLRLRLSYDRSKTISSNLYSLFEKNHVVFVIIGSGLLASIMGLYSIFLYTGQNPIDNQQSFIFDINSALANNLNNPVHLMAVITNSISAILFIVLASVCAGAPIKDKEQLFTAPFAKLIIVVISMIAVTGGTNPERYWYWAMPFFVLCLLPAINNLLVNKRYLVLGICLLWAAFIQRAMVPIDLSGIHQDCGVLAILTGHSNWIGHWSDQCDLSSQKNLVWLATSVVFLILLLSVLPSAYKTLKTTFYHE